MRDSLPALVSPAHCKLHNFRTGVYAVCDAWVGSNDGATLEVPNAKVTGEAGEQEQR